MHVFLVNNASDLLVRQPIKMLEKDFGKHNNLMGFNLK